MDMLKFLDSLNYEEIKQLKNLLQVETNNNFTTIDEFIVENPDMSFRLKNALTNNKQYLPQFVEEIDRVHLLKLRNLGLNTVKEFKEVFAKFKGK